MSLNYITRKIAYGLGKTFCKKDRELWLKVLYENERFKKRMFAQKRYTSRASDKKAYNKRVVCIYDENVKSGGLADRLKGMISMYELCKELSIGFKILFTHPFNLTDFLIPNKINWNIKNDELNYNLKATDICYISTLTGTVEEVAKQKAWFVKWFRNNKNEYHVRTNAHTFDKKNFAKNFGELFTIAPRLQCSIEIIKKELGSNYISTSFRYLNLLGDFNETFMKEALPPEERKVLIEKNRCQIQELHNQYPDKKILVNSDSTTFLREASRLGYVYTIPGNITHIDGDNNTDEYTAYEKTFLDFFMIANAEKIFLFRTGKMYKSDYPGVASLINGRPYEIIEF